MDFQLADSLFNNAADRGILFEHEVYSLLQSAGLTVPQHFFIKKGTSLSPECIDSFQDRQAVIKVVSKNILHKTEAGGVSLNVPGSQLENEISRMRETVPSRYARWILENFTDRPDESPGNYLAEAFSAEKLAQAIERDIEGFLITEFIDYLPQYGNELLIGCKYDDAFGPVLLFGAGGTLTGHFTANMKKDRAFAIASALNADDERINRLVEDTAVSGIIAGKERGTKRMIDEKHAADVLRAFAALASRYSNANPDARWSVQEIEVNPAVIRDGKLYVLDALLRFETKKNIYPPRPYRKTGKLLKPETAGIVGVSASKPTFGSIILKNLLKSGMRKENVSILHPAEKEIMGCRCFPGVQELKESTGAEKIDLFIVGAPARAEKGRGAVDIIEQIVQTGLAETIMIISAGFGETKEGSSESERLDRLMRNAKKDPDGGPLVNGPNTMGNFYYGVDTRFTPPQKSSADGTGKPNTAFITQSGAFVLTKLSNLSGAVAPVAGITLGNQADLTASDCLKFLKNDPEIAVFGIYIEGFKDLDGYELVKTAEEFINSGKTVVVYKAGRTSEGKDASAGHTAAAAGDYPVCEKLLSDAGIYIADDYYEFQDCILLASLLNDTNVTAHDGPARLAAASNAGFEKCGIADNLYDEAGQKVLQPAPFTKKTIQKLKEMYGKYRLSSIIDISPILDLTPMAFDAVWEEAIRIVMNDPNVDCGLFAIIPETGMLQTLNGFAREDINSPESIVQRLIRLKKELAKPFVISVESGRKYDPVRYELLKNGIPCFYRADRTARLLGKYMRHRMTYVEMKKCK